MLDPDLVTRKMALILPDLREAERLAGRARGEFIASHSDQTLAERYLERMIGRMIDINYHLITEAGEAPPRDYYESFVMLGGLGALPADFARTIARWSGLRNRIAHEYEEMDPAKLHDGLRSTVAEIPIYLRHIEAYIDRAAPGRT